MSLHIIKQLMKRGLLAEAEVAFQTIPNPSCFEYSYLISEYLKAGMIHKAEKMADQLHLQPNIRFEIPLLNTLISLECARFDFPRALSILETIKQQVTAKDYHHELSIGYSTIISHVGKTDPTGARQFYDQIKDDIYIDVINALMAVHMMHKDWPRVIAYYNEAKERGLESDLVTKNILIVANLKLGNVDLYVICGFIV
jgi:hypothetical protein